jgi:hypothetical protein
MFWHSRSFWQGDDGQLNMDQGEGNEEVNLSSLTNSISIFAVSSKKMFE